MMDVDGQVRCERCELVFEDPSRSRLATSITGAKVTILLYEHETELDCIEALKKRIRNLQRVIADRSVEALHA